MAFYPVSGFWYDSSTNNIVLQFAVNEPDAVDYEYSPDDPPYSVYEAEIFLDANQVPIGRSYPPSVDGETEGVYYGRRLGQTRDIVPTNPLEESPDQPVEPAP